MRSVPIVLGCLLAFVAVALAQSNETAETAHQPSACVDTYHDGSFWRNCSITIDGEVIHEETNLSWEQWNTQFVLPAFILSVIAVAMSMIGFFGFLVNIPSGSLLKPWKWTPIRSLDV